MSPLLAHNAPRRFPRGVHPPEEKHWSRQRPIEVMAPPAIVQIALHQHTGTPCTAVVQPRQQVAAGDRIGDSDAPVSAPVHTPVAGTVQRETVATLPNGRHVRVVPVQTAPNPPAAADIWNDMFGGDWPADALDRHTPEDIVRAVRAAGIVGQGGAAFPTHVKLARNPKKPVDTVLVNGCECEPYLTADERLMIEAPRPILLGAQLAARAAGASRIVVALEDNKPEAARALSTAASGLNIEILTLETKYPMGGEKQTVRAALGRTIPTGGLPLDVGVVVINVSTAAAIARAVLRGKPLTHRVVTVTGPGIVEPKNLLVPIGALYADLIAACGGLKPAAARVIAGGPMMGFSLGSFQTPITKGTSGIVVLTAETRRAPETPCLRCGRCVDVCPLNLVPTRLALAARHKDWPMARRFHITACMECGCCAYVCPAAIPLVQLIRTGKVQMQKETAP
ncbi:MAG: electron transport complex subunit RsxC [Kiritimatiellae bacterium]|nr:electron transport complex subunit RsxC [Kiritimatiellia bacterium]